MERVECESCGKSVEDYPSNSRSYCSRRCADDAKRVYEGKKCKVDGCGLDAVCREMCNKHYQHWYKYGDPSKGRILEPNDECNVQGCPEKPRSNSARWCEKHYGRWRRNGDPEKLQIKQYEVDEGAFDEIGSEQAWLIGLVWSDGWIDKNTVGVTSVDRRVLEQDACSVLGASGVIHPHSSHESAIVLRFASEPIADKLRSIGLHESKSLTIEWPTGITGELKWPFIRGLLDGDGWASLGKHRDGQQAPSLSVGWCGGSSALMRKLASVLESAGMSVGVRAEDDRENPLYRVVVQEHESLARLHRLLYPRRDVPCIRRKRNKFTRWVLSARVRPGRPAEGRWEQVSMWDVPRFRYAA